MIFALCCRTQGCFGVSEINVNMYLALSKHSKVSLFPFPRCTVTLGSDLRSLWEVLGGRFTDYFISDIDKVSFLRRAGLLFIKRLGFL